jgi:hypothetical protein
MRDRLAGSWLTVRECRAEVRQARLAERARQAAGHAALVEADDRAMREWLTTDHAAAGRLLRRRLERLAVPLADRLPGDLGILGGRPAAEDAQGLLEALSQEWIHPPVALIGRAAQVVWSPAARGRPAVHLDLVAFDSSRAARFLAGIGAVPRAGGQIHDLGRLSVRLRRSPPPSTVLVAWRPGRPATAIPVARPEGLPDAVVDRHALRAVLAAARRDGRGRRYPPYHEALGVAAWPLWFEPGRLRTIVRP